MGINLVPSHGEAQALPAGPPPHTFVTASQGLSRLLDHELLEPRLQNLANIK